MFKKHVSFVFGAILAVFIIMSADVPDTQAFCIYNNIGQTVQVKQTHGGKAFRGFSAHIDPTKRACCNWKNDDCNKDGDKDSTLRFTVEIIFPEGGTKEICRAFPIKAGGWMTIDGEGNCHAYY